MKKIDYQFKKEVLHSPDFQLYKKYTKVCYLYTTNNSNVSLEEYNLALDFLVSLEKNNPTFYKECQRVSNSHILRVSRLKKRIGEMLLLGKCLFLTFTFKDKFLDSLQPHYRRKCVCEYLAKFSDNYVANIDFGSNHIYIDDNGVERVGTNREHYHALILADRVDYSLWKFGCLFGEKIRFSIKELEEGNKEVITRLARYVAKLTNHAIKESTKRNAIIYSRKKTSEVIKKRLMREANFVALFGDVTYDL